MVQGRRFGAVACVLLVLPALASAEDYEIRWSATLEAALHRIASEENTDDVTGFFDQHEFTPNKEYDVPVEIGVTQAAFDLLGEGETPLLRLRLSSPTSNLGLSEPDHAFLNQRGLLLGSYEGLFLDMHYRRLRNDDLRRFPDLTGSALTLTDFSDSDDRFYRERTGFDGTLRFRPQQTFEGLPGAFTTLGGELEVRGGYEVRDGGRQLRFQLPPTNGMLSLEQDREQDVSTVGGGLLVAPGGLFTLALDVDHQRFREDSPTLTEAGMGAPFSSTRAIGFVPDTDRTSGTLRLRSRIGERAEIQGGFRFAVLEQVSGRTPDQVSAGLDDNRVLFTSANFATDVQILEAVSANAFFKYDERDNQLDRDTALFNGGGGTQVDAYLDHWRRILAGGEIVYAFVPGSQVSVGARAEWVDRDLDFSTSPAGRRILPANALISDETRMVTMFGRTRLRPLAGLNLRAEIGYREAPETGYVVDLDDYFYGRGDVSYVVPIEMPVLISGYARGGSGENRDFDAVGGVGPAPAGGRTDRDFERTEIHWGVTATVSPVKRLTLFSSFFQSRDAQDYDLVLSDQPRFVQDVVPLTFTSDGPIDYRSDDLGVLSGANLRIDDRTDAGLSYSFNRIKTRYRSDGSASGATQTIENTSRIDADIHRVGVRLGRRIRDGLRVSAGYAYDFFDDRSPVRGSGVVPPFDLGTHEHTVTIGVTLTNEILD